MEVVERAKGLPRLHIHLAHHIECPPRILVTESGMRGPARRVRRRVAHRQDHPATVTASEGSRTVVGI